MNILVDFHHAGLLNSLILLFEKRLGCKVYRPIGREWFDEGYWKVYDHPATVAQFLDIGGANPDKTDPVNEVEGEKDGIFLCHDIASNETNRAITLDKFRKMNFSIVIASIPQHVTPFLKLCEKHWSMPKLIFQIGNQWQNEASNVENIMVSARIDTKNKHSVVYHQEFDTNVFCRASSDVFVPKITSLINCFPTDGMFKEDWELFQKVETLMPKIEFKCLGGQGRDGMAHGEQGVADEIRSSGFVWQTKRGGDGYGHIVHNTGACGIPMLVKKEYYEGKMGEDLMIDGVTCVCIDNLNPQQIVDKIHYYSAPLRWKSMCENTYRNFKKNVDFDNEEKKIRHFLSELV